MDRIEGIATGLGFAPAAIAQTKVAAGVIRLFENLGLGDDTPP